MNAFKPRTYDEIWSIICFELGQDPVVTLCGRLYCWRCLYRWLYHHSNCHECPVCKTLILEEKLVPLYGRIFLAPRPAGQRPDTVSVRPPGAFQFPNFGFGLLEGFMLMVYAGMENFSISTAFGGLIPALFSVQFHGFQDSTIHGATSGYPFGIYGLPNGGMTWGSHLVRTGGGLQADDVLKNHFRWLVSL